MSGLTKIYKSEYRAWQNMMQRCYNPKHPQYKLYGGRGVRVCSAWHDFKTFLADMGHKPGRGYSLSRIDNDKDYCAENCVWVTAKERAALRRYHKDLQKRAVQRNNTSGCAGVHYNRASKTWLARVGISPGKYIYLGSFKTKEAAEKARLEYLAKI